MVLGRYESYPAYVTVENFDSYGSSAKFAVSSTLSESSGELAFKSKEELLDQEREFLDKWQYDFSAGYEDGYNDGYEDGQYPSDYGEEDDFED